MRRMIRKQIYIEEEQDKALKRASRVLGVSQAEWIRRGIGERIARIPETAVSGDLAWRKAMKVMKERARKAGATGTRRAWKREDLHDR